MNADYTACKVKVKAQLTDLSILPLLPYSVPALIENVSSIMKLEEGDIIMTGTPKGVGRVVPGETITCDLAVDGKVLSQLTFPVIDRPNPKRR